MHVLGKQRSGVHVEKLRLSSPRAWGIAVTGSKEPNRETERGGAGGVCGSDG